MNITHPQSLMASFTSAIDVMTQRFCCRPSNLVETSPPASSKPGLLHNACRVNKGKGNIRSPGIESSIDEEILIPTLERDRCLRLKPRQTLSQRNDTTSTAIVGPPAITRFPNPWILIAQDKSTPVSPLPGASRPCGNAIIWNRENDDSMPPILSFSPIETTAQRETRHILRRMVDISKFFADMFMYGL